MLITKHMLFVGFSLNDDNFHKIMDAVRAAMSGTKQSEDKNVCMIPFLPYKCDLLPWDLLHSVFLPLTFYFPLQK